MQIETKKELWTLCYDVACHFRHQHGEPGRTFFKRAKAGAIAIEQAAGGDITVEKIREGLQDPREWKQGDQ